MNGRRFSLLIVVAAIACACSSPPPSLPQVAPPAPPEPRHARLLDKVWRVTAPAGKPLGSMYIFMSDGTLLMTSCVETYRLAKWRADPDGKLTVSEDPATTYRVSLEFHGSDVKLRFELKNEVVDLWVRVADTPFVCPDLRR